MKEITKERLMHIANDIQAIEMSEMTNAILAVKLEKNITEKTRRTNYISSLKQLIIKKNINIYFDNLLEHGEIKIFFKNGDIRTYLLVD
jgi:hypothetical protein|nr:MAG TPA: hypothetical protein [Caudoviricetes sp.]